MNTSITTTSHTERIRTALFPDDKTLDGAIQALVRQGYPEDVLGVTVRGGDVYLLSVVAAAGRERDMDARLQALGARAVWGIHDLPSTYGAAPHPGVRDEHDMKMPMGREFPATTWAPEIAGYRVRPPVLDPAERIWTTDEVERGYTLSDAFIEADRCLRCPEPPCVAGCPAHNHIPDFIAALKANDFQVGIDILRQTTDFPGICGRVCDKARQCEGACILHREGGDPIAIGLLERLLADWELDNGLRHQRTSERAPATGHHVAIIGSGPAGLAAAQELALRGHAVTVFESLPVLGGALAWGIPAFRLPQAVLTAEIDVLRGMDVEFRLNTRVGPQLTIDHLLQNGFDAVFIGTGAAAPLSPGLPGEDLEGVYSATEFLSLAKLSWQHPSARGKAPVVGQRLVVIGAGNTAMDVAQTAVRLSRAELLELSAKQTTLDVAETARRLGFQEVTIIYRRSEAEMPARREEIESAREEGVNFRFLTAPVRFISDDNGRLRTMECIEMALGQPDARGRRTPVPKIGTEFLLDVDTVVLALGYQTDRSLSNATPGLATDKTGTITIDRRTGRTSRPSVWAGGDVNTGPDTVVRAMVAGRRAAADIDQQLRSKLATNGRKEVAL